jgi:hypothetical protein
MKTAGSRTVALASAMAFVSSLHLRFGYTGKGRRSIVSKQQISDRL